MIRYKYLFYFWCSSKKSKSKTLLPNSTVMKWPELSGKPSRINSFSHSWILTSNTLILVSNTEMLPMIKSLLMQPTPSKSAKSVLNAQLSLLMKPESRNLILSTCGKVLMVPSEIFWTEPFLENQSSLKTSQDLSQDGKNPLLLEDTHLATNTELPISLWTDLGPLKLFSETIKEKNKEWKSINLKEKEEWVWPCIMLMKALKISPTAVSNLLFKENYHFIWRPKIQFSKSTTEDSKISLKEFIKNHTRRISKKRKSGMNTD